MDILIIGGGITGIALALELANHGFKIYVVEKLGFLGGLLHNVDKLFNFECAGCYLSRMLDKLLTNHNINIITSAEVADVVEEDDCFRIKIIQYPRYVDESRCYGCNKCSNVCPASLQIEPRLNITRKLIYLPNRYTIPRIPVLDELCRSGRARQLGACIGTCTIDCSVCRECPISRCIRICPRNAIELWQRPKKFTLKVDIIVICTGMEPLKLGQGVYGYGERVITSPEYERMLMSLNRFEMPDFQARWRNLKRIVWIQCVGAEFLNYCSKICCKISAKQAIATAKLIPEAELHIIGTRFGGFVGLNELGLDRKISKYGVNLVNGQVVDLANSDRGIIVKYLDMFGRENQIECDLTVLSVGFVGHPSNDNLSKLLGVDIDEHKFFETYGFHTKNPRIFVSGSARSPVDSHECLNQARELAELIRKFH